MIFRLPDASNIPSTTLGFVFVAAHILFLKFLLADLTLPVVGKVPSMSAGEFGSAFALILGIWLGRKWLQQSEPSDPAKGSTN